MTPLGLKTCISVIPTCQLHGVWTILAESPPPAFYRVGGGNLMDGDIPGSIHVARKSAGGRCL